MSGHPYWSQAKQYQQRQGQQQQPARQQTQQPRRGVRDDFGNEWMGKDVNVEVARGTSVVVLRGRVVDVAKYWIKLIVDGGVVYVNKAAVISIKPLQ